MILHVDLDAFFASVEQRDNPRLRGKPLIVGSSGNLPRAQSGIVRHLAQRGVVATASYEARKYGIYSGMPLSRAAKLCPNAFFIKGDFAKYEQASEQFVRICSSYSPVIEQISLDELYIDLKGTELIWPTPRWVAQKIQEKVKVEIGITCSVGIATQKAIAKVASNINKPNAITEVPPGREKYFLASLPVDKLPGCGKKTQEFFKKIGIKIIGQLATLNKTHLKTLLGEQGSRLWELANGRDNSQVTAPERNKSISRSTTFPFDTNNRSFIESMLFYLVHKVAQDARSMRVFGRCVTVVVRTAEFQTHSIQKTVIDNLADAHGIILITRELLYSLWDGAESLRLVGISLSNLSFNQLKTQFHLFEIAEIEEKWLTLEKAMDKVREKYGFLSILPASLIRLRGVYPTHHRGFRPLTSSLSR